MIKKIKKLTAAIWLLLLLGSLVLPAGAVDGIEIRGGTNIETLPEFLDRFINFFLIGFMGIGAFVTFIIAGFTYLVAGSNADRAGKAKKMMFFSVLGLILSVLCYAIFAIVINMLNDIF